MAALPKRRKRFVYEDAMVFRGRGSRQSRIGWSRLQAFPFEPFQADALLLHETIEWMLLHRLECAIPEMTAHAPQKPGCERATDQAGHVLITSASRKAPLIRAMISAARRVCCDTKVFAGDVDERAPARHVADDFWRMPATTHSELDSLVAGCKERGIRTILPTRDGELRFWADHRAYFANAGIAVLVSSIDAVRTCLDKLEFARFGLAAGLPFIPAGVNAEDVGPGPYVVKERFGAGSRLLGLLLDEPAALAHAQLLQDPIYQPYVAGQEISIDAWLDKTHRVKGLVLRTRDHIVGGESQVTTTFRDSAIELLAVRVLESLRLRGPVVMQALIDADKKLHIIECNARFGGASTASIAAGLDMLHWSLLEAGGADMDQVPFLRTAGEVRQVRLPSDVIIHDPDF